MQRAYKKITAAQFGKLCDRILQEAGDPLKCLRFARRYRLGFSESDADNDHRSVFAVVQSVLLISGFA